MLWGLNLNNMKYILLTLTLLISGCASHGPTIHVAGGTRCFISNDKGTWDVPEAPITASVDVSQAPVTIKCEASNKPVNNYPDLVLITLQ